MIECQLEDDQPPPLFNRDRDAISPATPCRPCLIRSPIAALSPRLIGHGSSDDDDDDNSMDDADASSESPTSRLFFDDHGEFLMPLPSPPLPFPFPPPYSSPQHRGRKRHHAGTKRLLARASHAPSGAIRDEDKGGHDERELLPNDYGARYYY